MLIFLSSDYVSTYLEGYSIRGKHPNPYLKDWRIIGEVARLFANTEKTESQLKRNVRAILWFVNVELGLSDKILRSIEASLSAALSDCGKPFLENLEQKHHRYTLKKCEMYK